ncbi:MAG: family 16 glycosylhydrolase [Acidimicrobiia bacterium]|nr:family 16 glycosylhydrolase [Acidimicrobiia bacterium]
MADTAMSGGGLTKWNRQDHPIAQDFHTYAVEWEPDEIRWYYDGEHYHTVDRQRRPGS